MLAKREPVNDNKSVGLEFAGQVNGPSKIQGNSATSGSHVIIEVHNGDNITAKGA